jgi:photosystem II stability/assembly factor-like uncharacterized protein
MADKMSNTDRINRFPQSSLIAGVAVLLVLLLSLGSSPAAAAPQYSVLTTRAIPVSHPDRVLLIGIANAGSRLVAVGEHGVIIYSDDNGQTWRQAVVPVSISITCVAFATPLVGWAAGDYGVVLHTQDGGATWQTQITGVDVNQLIMAAATRFVTSDPNNTAALTAARRANIFMAAGPDKPFLSILPITAQRAFVFGAYRMAVLTNDGGKSWADWSLHVGDPISHNIYDATRIGGSIYLAGEVGSVFRSDDQGATFPALTPPTQSTLFGILGAGNAVLTFGVAGGIFRSTDGGNDWTQINTAASADLTAGTVLKSGLVVVVSESGWVYVSADNGATFHAAAKNEGMGLFNVTQAANGDVVFVGDGGVRVAPAASLN